MNWDIELINHQGGLVLVKVIVNEAHYLVVITATCTFTLFLKIRYLMVTALPMKCDDCTLWLGTLNGPLSRHGKLRVAHAPAMPETFSPPTDFKGNR